MQTIDQAHATAQALEEAIATVPASERADLIAVYVRLDELRPGLDRARVVVGADSVPVWAVIGHLRGGDGVAATAAAYGLPEAAVRAALAYYAEHRPLIDHRLAVNDGEVGG